MIYKTKFESCILWGLKTSLQFLSVCGRPGFCPIIKHAIPINLFVVNMLYLKHVHVTCNGCASEIINLKCAVW